MKSLNQALKLQPSPENGGEAIPLQDEHHLIKETRKIADTLVQAGLSRRSCQPPLAGARIGKHKNGDRNDFIDASRSVLELGHPTASSLFMCILTREDDLVKNNRVTLLGETLSDLPPGRHSLALILFAKSAEVNENVRRHLNKAILSCNRLGGVMVRMSSGRIWFRFSREALTGGLTMDAIGRHILGQIKAGGNRHDAAEVVFVVGHRNHIDRLRPVAEKQAQARNDRYQSALVEKMTCETGLDCDQCPETETCKVLRKAVAVTRKKSLRAN